MPDVRKRLYAPSFSDMSRDSVTVDIGALAQRVLFHDTYVFHSVSLREIPQLAERFGVDAVDGLFRSGCIELSLDKTWVGLGEPDAQAADPYRVYPYVEGHNLPSMVEETFAELRGSYTVTDVSSWRSLNVALQRAMEASPPDSATLESAPSRLLDEFRRAALDPERVLPFVRAAVRRIGFDPSTWGISFVVHEASPGLGIDTNLEDLGLSAQQAGDVVRLALLALSAETSRSFESELYQALTPYLEDEVPLAAAHLDYAAERSGEPSHAATINRVVEVLNLPDLRSSQAVDALDLDRLIEVRNLPEAQAFRDWLWEAGSLSPADTAEQLEHHVASIGERAAWFLRTPRGGHLRWLAVAGVSVAAGALAVPAAPVVGLTLGAVNRFLIDEILPEDNRFLPAVFAESVYPSLFAPPYLPGSPHEERVERG